MAFDIQAARDDGYSDEEIRQYLANKGEPIPAELAQQTPAPQAAPQAAPVAPSAAYTPPPDQVADRGPEQWTTGAAAAGMGAAAVGIPAALAYGVKRGVSAGANAMDVAKQGISAMQEQNAVAKAHQQLQYDKMAARGQIPRPAAPAMNPAASPSWTAPAAQPAPAVNPAAAQQAQAAAAQANPTANNFIQRMSNLAKQYSPAAARLGVGAGAALYSGGLNTNEEQELARRRAVEVERARQLGWIK